MKIKQQGFTLIELVVVIIILGILAVTAAPKFLNLKGDATKATLDGVKGALSSANALVHSKAVIQSKGRIAGESITVDGSIAVTADFGYLDSTANSTTVAANLNKVMDLTFEAVTAGNDATSDFGVIYKTDASFIIVPKGKTDTDDCRLEYVPAKSVTVEPTYTVVSSGC